MLARAKRKRGDSSSDTSTAFALGKPVVKVAARAEDKQVPGQSLAGGVASLLKARVPTINVDTYNVTLPMDFLADEGVSNGICPSAQKLLFPSAKKHLSSMDIQHINA